MLLRLTGTSSPERLSPKLCEKCTSERRLASSLWFKYVPFQRQVLPHDSKRSGTLEVMRPPCVGLEEALCQIQLACPLPSHKQAPALIPLRKITKLSRPALPWIYFAQMRESASAVTCDYESAILL